jgi:hypothetical protein
MLVIAAKTIASDMGSIYSRAGASRCSYASSMVS